MYIRVTRWYPILYVRLTGEGERERGGGVATRGGGVATRGGVAGGGVGTLGGFFAAGKIVKKTESQLNGKGKYVPLIPSLSLTIACAETAVDLNFWVNAVL